MNPHMSRVAIDPPGPDRRWRCDYCKQVGLWDELQAKECTHVYPPCEYCGQTPECAIDCPAMMALLGSSAVHVVTDDPKLGALIERAKKREGKA